MHYLGKLLFLLGLAIAAIGLLLWKTNALAGLGRLPGDISIQRPNASFYFPITTCIIVSILLSLLMYLFRR